MGLSALPSVDRVLRSDAAQPLIHERGRAAVTQAIRQVLGEFRAEIQAAGGTPAPTDDMVIARVRTRVEADATPSMRAV